MPCIAMHLAIAKQYCKYNKNEDLKIFEFGAIEPDIAPDKVVSHYGTREKTTSVKQALENKTDIVKCINDLDFNKMQDRAKFLHLITDYLYYRYIYVDSVEQLSPEQLDQALYNDYNFMTNYILNKYQVTVPIQAQHLILSKHCDGDFEFITRQKTDEFIDKLAKLDLNKTKEEIVNNRQEFLDNFMMSMKK